MANILMVGNDARSSLTADILEKNANLKIIRLDNLSDFNYSIDLYVFPIPLSSDGIYVNNSLLKLEVEYLKVLTRDKLVVSAETLNRDDFAYKNAIPTAEAAIKLAIDATDKTLFDSKILITGFGRVSKILAHRISVFSNDVTVAVRKSSDTALIEGVKLKYIPIDMLAKYINEYDIIFNTVPYKIFDHTVLSKVKKNTVIIELASNTLGFDTEYINKADLKFINAPGLPGKFSPLSAAKILAETILQIMKENNIN